MVTGGDMTLAPSHDPLALAVVGHTNTGKTSLLRSLTRNPQFGEVRNEPGTTRQVESAHLLVKGTALVELFDTPGMEDSIALLAYIDEQLLRTQKLDGPDAIDKFLQSPESTGQFEQEARVLRALLQCHAGLYVIDARTPVLAKYKDELELLARCARPLLPVLNFTHDPGAKLDTWRTALRRLGLHVTVEFDTVAPALNGETELYNKLALLLDQHAGTLNALSENILEQRHERRQDAYRLVAELVIDSAALRLSSTNAPEALQQATQQLRHTIRQREQHCVQALLLCYNFDHTTFAAHELPLEGERWEMDLFHPEALKEMGIQLGKGVAAGAMAGATIDAITAGVTLGAGTLIGAAAGGLWQGADSWGKRLVNRLRGHQELTVDDHVLRLLIVRQLTLIQALEQRGHAAQHPLTLDLSEVSAHYREGKLPEIVYSARAHPEWSTLGDSSAQATSRNREMAIQALIMSFSEPASNS